MPSSLRSKLLLVSILLVAATLLFYSYRDATLSAFPRKTQPLDLPPTHLESNLDDNFIEPDQITQSTPVTPHRYREDGLLEVSLSAPHPIHDLIVDAENKWQRKLDRASGNLKEVVMEYQRRYGRLPPKGFDKWWQYVQQHNVQLPDEYDQIWSDIEPFWGIDPVDLQRIQAKHEGQSDSYTMGKVDGGEIKMVNKSLYNPAHTHLLRGAEGIISMLKDVEEHIPPFRAVFSPHDNPNLLIDYHIRQAAIGAARSHRQLKGHDLPPVNMHGWQTACPASTNDSTSTANSEVRVKTFIHDHRKTMDPCVHPEILKLHGQFLSYGDFPPVPKRAMIPQFSYCSTTLHYDIRMPTYNSWVEDIHPREYDPDWNYKPDERLSWRGKNTGMWYSDKSRWRQSQRPRLVDLANNMEGTVELLIPPTNRDDPIGSILTVPKSKVNPALFDIAFSGSPLCPPDYCPELKQAFDWRNFQGTKEAGRYKYIIDVDGNGWSTRFQRLLVSNALIFKATIYPEWFLDRIQPWKHYIPVQVDLSDLYDTLLFFRGGLYGEGSHHDLAQQIAQNSRQWVKSFWRKEDMTAYMFRLMLEYARVMSIDRENMSYVIA